MTGRGVAQGAGLGVEDDDRGRDELLVAIAGSELGVEFLERLRRISELAQENPEEILRLERGDGRLDAVTGHIADKRGHSGRADTVNVEEVAGHQARTGLVCATDLESAEVRDLFRCETSGPSLRGELILLERLAGPTFDVVTVAGHPGFAVRASRPPQRGDGRQDQKPENRGDGRAVDDRDGSGRDGDQAVDNRAVGFLAVRRKGERMSFDVGRRIVLDERNEAQPDAGGLGIDSGSAGCNNGKNTENDGAHQASS